MATIVTRSGKGSKLTHAEMDSNLTNLNADKLEKGLYANNNVVLIKNSSGSVTEVVIAEGRILGRLSGGEIKALTPAEVQTLIGLTAALSGKQDAATILANLVAISGASTGDTIMFITDAWQKVTKAQFKSNMAFAFENVSRKSLGVIYESTGTTDITAATTWTDANIGAPTIKINNGFTLLTNKITITNAGIYSVRWSALLAPVATAARRIQVSLSHYDSSNAFQREFAISDDTISPYGASSGRITVQGLDSESFSSGDYLKIRVRNVDHDDDVILSEVKVIIEQV